MLGRTKSKWPLRLELSHKCMDDHLSVSALGQSQQKADRRHTTPKPPVDLIPAMICKPSIELQKIKASGLLFPYSSQCNYGLHSALHILMADPFQRRVEGMATGKNIGSGKAHKAETRAVSAAPD